MANEQFIYASDYVFAAADLKRLLDSSPNIDTSDVAIQVLISKSDQEKVFNIIVRAILENKEGGATVRLMDDPPTGCPRPPSC